MSVARQVAAALRCGAAGGRRASGAPLRTALALLALALAGCAADKPKPTPLEPLAVQIAGREVWRARLDGVHFALTLPSPAALAGGAFVAAGDDGTVVALQPQDGREVWRGGFGAKLAAGVGSDGRFAAAVSVDNELIVVDRGRKLWSTRLGSSVSTAPLVAGERVFVVGVDRQVLAFDALDGRRLWSFQRAGGEALTLAQRAVVAPYKDTLLVGQGATLVGLDPVKGSTRFEVALTPPRGTNEVERLNDLVGPLLRVGDGVCVRAFQTAVGCMDLQRPALRWSRIAGGQQAVGGDADYVFGADASDRVSAWKSGGGELAWSNERLLYRGLSAPLSAGRTVAFGDAEGYVHFLSREDGKTLLRLPTDGSPVVAQPVLSGSTVLVATRNGALVAFRPE